MITAPPALAPRAFAPTLPTLARRGWVAKRGEARRKVLHLTATTLASDLPANTPDHPPGT